jgi:hypothetical protein
MAEAQLGRDVAQHGLKQDEECNGGSHEAPFAVLGGESFYEAGSLKDRHTLGQ